MHSLHRKRCTTGRGLVVKLFLFEFSVYIMIVRTGFSGMFFKEDRNWVDLAIRFCSTNPVMLIDTLHTLLVRA